MIAAVIVAEVAVVVAAEVGGVDSSRRGGDLRQLTAGTRLKRRRWLEEKYTKDTGDAVGRKEKFTKVSRLLWEGKSMG